MTMKKKTYSNPEMTTVVLRYQHHLLGLSSLSTDDDVELTYDKNGGNQAEAW